MPVRHLAAEPVDQRGGHAHDAACVLLRKNPVVWISSSTSAGSAAARSAGVGYLANSGGVTMLTRSSVVWADRIVAVSSW